MSERPKRLTFDELFDLLTIIYASRSTCDRLRTATTLRDKDNRFLSAGYNGSLSGDPQCDDPEVGHLMVEGHCIRTAHGEHNAVMNCLDSTRIKDGTATVLGNPCYPCGRTIIGLGVKRIRYIGQYSCLGSDKVAELAKRHRVRLEFIKAKDLIFTLQKALNFLQGPGGPFKDLPNRIEIKFVDSDTKK